MSRDTAAGPTVAYSVAPMLSVRRGARAIAAGAREIVPVAEAYGWRLGRVVDPFGHHWEIGHPLS